MASYRILIDVRVRKKDLPGIPPKDQKRIVAAIGGLAENPRPPLAKQLSNREEYRLRQGNYRILYAIDDKVVTILIVRVAHRKDAYKKR